MPLGLTFLGRFQNLRSSEYSGARETRAADFWSCFCSQPTLPQSAACTRVNLNVGYKFQEMWRYKPERQPDLESWARLWECGLWGWPGVRFFFFQPCRDEMQFLLASALVRQCQMQAEWSLISSYLGREIVKGTMWHPLPSGDDIEG